MWTRPDPTPPPGRSRAPGCLGRGCLAVLVALLVLVVGGWIWLATEPARDEAAARENLDASVERHRRELAGTAADGTLSDAEITAAFPPAKPAKGLVGTVRRGGTTSVVAGLLGIGPARTFIFVNETYVHGCFAFDVTFPTGRAPRVTSRELPAASCAGG
ncbi:hypothetical protein [Streptomyces sp. NPDC093111]|uniref:hypothetical protein n=1 Tax=Streptomyces sp. NPDC093111 TaxID=3154978 RepID=UPI0034370833